ncbi:MAG TPA: hypothetical protein VF785_24620 [Gemmatimonadaceae bacterium]
MRRLMIALGAALAACSSQMTPGRVGQTVDLRQYLPDTLRLSVQPADSTFRQEIPVGPNSAKVELTWTTFHHGSGRYLATISARLLEPTKYDSLNLGAVSALANVGSKFEPTESAQIGVAWFKKTLFVHQSGLTPFEFDAQGRRTAALPVAH